MPGQAGTTLATHDQNAAGVAHIEQATFADYSEIEEAFDAHGHFLSTSRYASVRAAKTPDDAARALRSCGYATDVQYLAKLIQLQPLTNDRDDIEALAIKILGFRFVLLLDAPDSVRHTFLQGARYRPGRILISYPNTTNWLTLSWEDERVHEPLTVQWVQQSGEGRA